MLRPYTQITQMTQIEINKIEKPTAELMNAERYFSELATD